MKRIITWFLLSIILVACGTSQSEWADVRQQLSEIKIKDQQYRTEMDSIGKINGWQSKQVELLWKKQVALDSENMVAIDKIIGKYGYPSRANVGDQAETPFLVIQHTNDSIMASYYNLIVGAGKNGDIRMKDVAQYQDQVLMMRKQPQEYGTQVWIEFKKDAETGERYDSLYLWPVRDQEHVNEKRFTVGLDSLELHLRRYGIDPSTGYLVRKASKVQTPSR